MPLKNYFLFFAMLMLVTDFYCQVGIGTTTPSPASMLEVSSQTDGEGPYRGFMPPRVPDITARDLIDPEVEDIGLMVFIQNIGCLQIWDGNNWKNGMCLNYPPVAKDVHFLGGLFVGQNLEAIFNYFDAEGDAEGIHLYKWYRADDASGTGAIAIPGAESKIYQIVSGDINKYISVEITPVATDGLSPGDAVESPYQGAVAVLPVATNLFISEYVEGSSNNKAIEIANFTGSSVNLNGYRLAIYSNGSPTATIVIPFNNNFVLPNGGVYVIKHSSALGSIPANQTSGSLGFNGDDAIALRTSAGVVIDVVGEIGDDFKFGEDVTLRKKPATGPSTTYDFADYDNFLEDTFDGLGWHTY